MSSELRGHNQMRESVRPAQKRAAAIFIETSLSALNAGRNFFIGRTSGLVLRKGFFERLHFFVFPLGKRWILGALNQTGDVSVYFLSNTRRKQGNRGGETNAAHCKIFTTVNPLVSFPKGEFGFCVARIDSRCNVVAMVVEGRTKSACSFNGGPALKN